MQHKPYKIMLSSSYITVKLMSDCDNTSAKNFHTEITTLLSESSRHLIFNCESVQGMSSEWFRDLLLLQKLLKDNSKSLIFILVSKDLKKIFKDNGLETNFTMALNLREALADLGLVTKKMLDTEFINPFLTATLHVLKVQANVEAKPGKIVLKTPGDKYVADISGVIGVVSETYNGSIVISFPEDTFLKVMSGMLGETYTEINQEIMDGAGEVTNMIFGQAKIVLNEKGYGIKTALPSVVTGKKHSLSSSTSGPVVIIPFESAAGDFYVEVSLSA